MKTYKTAEDVEREFERMKAKADRIIDRINKHITARTNALIAELSEDQLGRLKRRHEDREHRIVRPRIIH